MTPSDKNEKGESEEGKPKLLDEVRQVLRLKHYSYRTVQTYCDWIKRFLVFTGMHDPREMGKEAVSPQQFGDDDDLHLCPQ